MRSFTGAIQVVAIIAVLGAVVWYVQDATLAKQQNKTLKAAQATNSEIIRMLGQGIEGARQRAVQFRELNEDLANVEDDNTCRSPAVDRAFELMRRHRAGN
ncbi:hypothetical protein NBRC116590_02600 [Pelagimonas sp. KU-00592-HH]|uniref:hypothetical protein n=1 Tax=Pelagimonas sp. KU-00592-HH TaxID=3127651 RepID=UPI00310BEB71